MRCCWRSLPLLFAGLFICLLFSACSGTSTRFDPGVPQKVSGVSASAGNGQVVLSWGAAAEGAAAGYTAYDVYYGTSPSVSPSTGQKIAQVPGTSFTITGLANNTTYYFVVAAVTTSGEGPLSEAVSATPVPPGPFAQADLAGVWNFNILVAGAAPGWMRGKMTVDNAGGVSFNSFQDSAGGTVAPAALFPTLLLNPTGQVRDDGAPGLAVFHGTMERDGNLIVGTAAWGGGTRFLAILQRQLPQIIFRDADIMGFGGAAGGGRRFAYDQISAGARNEWEFALGQMGRDQKVQYSGLLAPSNPARPADKATIFTISSDGIVSESLTGVLPQPEAVMDRGVMSADKTMIVGTATVGSGAGARYLLRIYQFINIIPSDPSTFAAGDLTGEYAFQKLVSAANPLSATGTLSIDPSGSLSYPTYSDSNGTGSVPGSLALLLAANGMVTTPSDATLYGKLSYFKKVLIFTQTEGAGAHSLTIGLKQ